MESLPGNLAVPTQIAREDLGDTFKKVLRGYAASVSIISTEDLGSRYGIVVTATMSVSLAPPLMMISVNQTSSCHDPIRQRGAFCVNMLAQDQENIGQMFFSRKGEERFAAPGWEPYVGTKQTFAGLPYLSTAQASIFCNIRETLAFGTHTLFLGEVEHLIHSPQIAPLVYCDGRYGSVAGLQSH